jgi:hypothetical protein
MATGSSSFQHRLGDQLAIALGEGWKHYKSRNEVRAATGGCDKVVILSGSNKYSPHIELAFYFGCKYSAATKVEKLLGRHQSYYHIHQYSYNRRAFSELPFAGPSGWAVNIESPPLNLVLELADAIRGIAFPFFQRFASMRAARDALAADDPWCFGGSSFWHQLLLLDLALDDTAHFKDWAGDLDAVTRGEAQEQIEKYEAAAKSVV